MHELSNALKSVKQSNINQMTTSFEEKVEILQEKFFFFFFQANINDITNLFILLAMSFDSRSTLQIKKEQLH